ncbi:MAG: hypothetical protein FWC66_10015 [Oscillospiraceae bacterium]|nr:hypothetical protein [Oscillospiraceae bacterium]
MNKCKCIEKLTDEQLEKMWADLSDIPFDEADVPGDMVLAKDWCGFTKGTDRLEIWKFFDMHHSKGVAFLLYREEPASSHLVSPNDWREPKNNETNLCIFCEVQIPWEGGDEQRGTLWSCQHCGNSFCEGCFKERHGTEIAHEMFCAEGDLDEICCPDCFEKHKQEALKGITERICVKCKSSVMLSKNLRYTFQCLICDEDLYSFETELRQPPVVEGTKEDTSFKGVGYVDEMCSHCMNETFNIPTNRVSLCAHCGEELFPCAGCEDSADSICTWDSYNLRCDRFNHSDVSKLGARKAMLAAMQRRVLELEASGNFRSRTAQVNYDISKLKSEIKELEQVINSMEVTT